MIQWGGRGLAARRRVNITKANTVVIVVVIAARHMANMVAAVPEEVKVTKNAGSGRVRSPPRPPAAADAAAKS